MDIDINIEQWLREANRCCADCFDDKDEIASHDYKKIKEEEVNENEEKSS